MPKEKSCGAVVFVRQKDGIKYLLLHYGAGHWDFPKGKQEKNETEEQAAAREIKEETGIEDIEFAEGFKETVKYFYKKDEETIFKEVVFFLAQAAIVPRFYAPPHCLCPCPIPPLPAPPRARPTSNC